jgi:3D (Asp-Asp-Asp) domain-containing protein
MGTAGCVGSFNSIQATEAQSIFYRSVSEHNGTKPHGLKSARDSRQASERTANAYLTLYGYPDNNPSNSAAIAHPVVHQKAGGIGTFKDPITFATDVLPFGTKIYVPHLQKYFIAEDTIGHGRYTGNLLHVDLWAGGSAQTNPNLVRAVEHSNTRHNVQIILNAMAGHPVNTTPFIPRTLSTPHTIAGRSRALHLRCQPDHRRPAGALRGGSGDRLCARAGS